MHITLQNVTNSPLTKPCSTLLEDLADWRSCFPRSYPHLQTTVVELPEMTPITEHFIIEEVATDRVKVIAADVIDGTLSGEFDVAILRRFYPQFSAPAQVGRALKNVYSVIKPGGVVYILANVLENSRTSPVDAVYWDLVYINIYNDGQAYTEQQYREWLSEAGFIDFEGIAPPSNEYILVARKLSLGPSPEYMTMR